MRLVRTSAAVMAVALLALPVGASPLHWPEENEMMALHCAAVLQAYGHAYEFAADLIGQPAIPVAGLPAPLLQLAGGAAVLPEISIRAEGFHSNAESVARTSFYPALVGDGTPYLADDGRALVLAVQTCVAQFEL
ncbi:MAG TPA: hypothetical protein EYP31_10180 [Roseibacterium sp.]|nr:hypothetical protein [Roseibacterium sp.]